MIELLWYILSNFWPFVGFVSATFVVTWAIVGIAGSAMIGIANIISAWRFPR